MKFVLLIAVFMFMASGVHAESSSVVSSDATQTQADWFSPSCPNCAKLLTPGTASLGNSKGIFRPNAKKQNKKTELKKSVEVEK